MKYTLLFLFLVCVFSCTYCSIIRKNQPFRSKKSPSETIYNYVEVRPVIVSSTQISSENHPKYLKIILRLDEAQFNLDLQLNELLLPPHFSSIHQDQSGEEIKNGHQNCFYQGTVLNHTDWKAAFSTCYGLRGWFGDINDKNYLYHIEPLDNTNTLTSLHAIYMESEHRNTKIGTCGTTHHHDIENSITKQSFRHHRLKRNEDLIVELLVVNDYYQYMAYDEDLSAVVMRAIEIVNQVDMLYQDLNIRVVLVNSMTWTESQLIPFQTDANTLLGLFETYHSDNISPSISHDSAMLITGINIAGNTVGVAYVGTMCNFDSSVGVTQDTGSSVSSVGATAAHELGHIFVMRHDDDSSCNCPDQSSSGCIMNAASGFPPPTQWSQCSRDELDFGLENGLGSCLDNNPTTIVGDPQCGNGIKEPDEVCDCGSPEECQDPCCNATTCVLNNNAQCATGPCCTNCQFVAYGTTCRKSDGVCDITEYCTGEDSDCPRDVYLQNGQPCNNSFYCYGGNCISHDTQCMQYYGTVSQTSNDACYEQQNTQGQGYGNCGAANGAFISCSSNHVQCGSLQCDGGDINFDNIQFTGTIFTFTRQVFSQGSVHGCQSFTVGVNSDVISPGLVIDGTKCGNEMLCVAQQCRAISSLSITACPVGENGETCSGNGVCNDINECSCFVGYRGDDCTSTIESTSTGTPNTESTNAPNPVTESTNAPNPTIESTSAPNPTIESTSAPNTGTKQTIMSTFTESSIFQSATIRPSSVASSNNVIIAAVVVPIILIGLAAVVIVIVVVIVVKKKKSANVDLSARYSKGTKVDVEINGSIDDLLMSAQTVDGSSPTNVRRPPPSRPYNPPYTPSNPPVTVNNNSRRPPPSVPPSLGTTKNPYVVVNNAYKRPPPPIPPSTKPVSVNQGNQSRKPPPPVARPAPRPAPRSPPSVPVSKPTLVTPGPSIHKPVVPPPKPQIAPKPQTAPKPQVAPTPQTAPKPSQIHRQWPPPSQQGDKPIPPKRPFLPPKN